MKALVQCFADLSAGRQTVAETMTAMKKVVGFSQTLATAHQYENFYRQWSQKLAGMFQREASSPRLMFFKEVRPAGQSVDPCAEPVEVEPVLNLSEIRGSSLQHCFYRSGTKFSRQ